MAEYKPILDSIRKKDEVDPQVQNNEPSLYERLTKNIDAPSDQGRALMIGATPLLAGLLAGNTGDAVEIAGKALIEEDKRVQDQENRLIDFLRKKRISQGKASLHKPQQVRFESGELGFFQGGKYYMPSGEEVVNPKFYRETPSLVMQKELARKKVARQYGAGRSFGKDEEGRDVIRDVITGKMEPVRNLEGLAPNQRKRVTSAMDTFNSLTKKQRDGLNAAEQFLTAIRLNNPVSDQFAIFKLAKTADDGGRLSDQDVERFGGSKALGAQIRQVKETAKTGQLTDANRRFMTEIAMSMIKHNQDKIEKRAKSYAKRRSKVIGVDIYEYIKPEKRKVIITDGKEQYEIELKDLTNAQRDGYWMVR